jgi:hypothetical protein
MAAAPDAPEAPDTRDAPETPDVPDVVEVDIAPAIETLRVVLPRIPQIVAHSMKAVDHAAIARALEAVRVEHLSPEAMGRVRRAMPKLEAMRVHLRHIDPKELEARIRVAMPDHAHIQREVRRSLRASGRGMEEGARGMEAGAAKMEAQARRFRDASERERIIQRERARGRTVTHEDLLEAAEGMEEGARGMREGAQQMRRGARDMDDHD